MKHVPLVIFFSILMLVSIAIFPPQLDPQRNDAGLHTVSIEVTDSDKNDNGSFSTRVTSGGGDDTPPNPSSIADNISPTITAPDDIVAEATGVQTIIDIGAATATDNRDPNPAITDDAPDSFLIGETIITYTATDNSGNTATDTQIVTIQDTTPPTITAPDNLTVEAAGLNTMVEDLGAPVISDVVDFNLTFSNDAAANSFPIGDTIITWTATDSAGNTATDTQTVTVQDTISPVFSDMLSDISIETDNPSELVSYQIPSATDIFDLTVMCTPPSGSEFTIGTTVISCIATDQNGNTATATFNVVVSSLTSSVQRPPYPHDVNDDPSFEAISDDFRNANHWDFEQSFNPNPGTYHRFASYTFAISNSSGNPAPAGLISGDGFTSISSIARTTSLDELTDDDSLYLSFDYRVTSDTGDSRVTNGRLHILDSDGNILHNVWLVRGGTTDTNWRTYNLNITDIVANTDEITVRISSYDPWVADWNQKLYVDNFYIGLDDPSFEAISDDFRNANHWDFEQSFNPNPGTYHRFASYTFAISNSSGNPAPAGLISGDGFTSISSIARTTSLDELTDDDSLYLSFDYRVTSDTGDSRVTNGRLHILDSDGNILHNVWLVRGGTTDTNWRTYNLNITDIVANTDEITVRISSYDPWVADWNQKLYVDNFYVGLDDPSLSGGASGAGLEDLPPSQEQIISQLVKNYGTDIYDVVNGTLADGSYDDIIEEMLRNYNYTSP